MTEQNETEAVVTKDELTMLKDRAKVMGVPFSNNIGIDALRKRIDDKLAGMSSSDEDEKPLVEVNALTGEAPADPAVEIPTPTLRQYLFDDSMKLIRVKITNLDPKKREWPGEIKTVANKYIGTVRKFIPFGDATDEGYHIPNCILRMLKRCKYQDIKVIKKNGKESITSRWVSEYAIEILPPLTQAELKQLATAQQAVGSVER